MAGERILVVDDAVDMREFLVEYVLEPNGYQWLVAEDGQRGLDTAIAESPDLILLDLQMPRMDGTGMLKAMKEYGLKVPVVLNAERTDSGRRQIFLMCGLIQV